MKVVEEKVWWKFTCTCCKSVCEAEPEDAKVMAASDYEGDRYWGQLVVLCGKCGKEHRIPADKLTGKVKEIAMKNKYGSLYGSLY